MYMEEFYAVGRSEYLDQTGLNSRCI